MAVLSTPKDTWGQLISFIDTLGSLQPPQFKLDPRLARLLGIHTQTRPVIIQALWQYIKTHKLQDPHEREFVICDKYLQQVCEGHILFWESNCTDSANL